MHRTTKQRQAKNIKLNEAHVKHNCYIDVVNDDDDDD